MPRSLWLTSVLVISAALLPCTGLAEEHSEGVSPSDTAAAPEPAAIVPPALKPITITFSGELVTVGAGASPASVTVQDRYGVKKEIAVPAEARVAQGSAPKDLASLKAGDKVTVEYTYDVATGKRTAQSISAGGEVPAAQ